MSDWLVCKMKDGSGRMFIMSRGERELMMCFYMFAEETVDSIVIKTFYNRNEAIKYLLDMDDIDDLLNDVL
jgi:hypothetical protein